MSVSTIYFSLGTKNVRWRRRWTNNAECDYMLTEASNLGTMGVAERSLRSTVLYLDHDCTAWKMTKRNHRCFKSTPLAC